MNILDFIMVAITILFNSLALAIVFTWLMYSGEKDDIKK